MKRTILDEKEKWQRGKNLRENSKHQREMRFSERIKERVSFFFLKP